MKAVGLVLGAGGVVGGAFHAGTLKALAETTGWDPRTAELVIGTSAGSLTAAALRAGMSADDQYARVTGGSLSSQGRQLTARLRGERGDGTVPLRPRLPRWPVPASPRMAVTALLRPWDPRPGAALAGLLPAGSLPTEGIGDRVRDLYEGIRWPDQPLWITALRLRDGARVVFG
ncbi:MAG: patatin-like phospholipase family protein, partial [Acidimicrobiales bacterium]